MDDAELVRRAAASTPDALCTLDTDGIVGWANQAFAELVGHPLADLPGTDAHLFSDETGQAQFDAHIEEMRSGHRGAQNEEVLIRRTDGTELWCLGTWWPIHDDDGSTVAYLHRFTEHTARRHHLDELQEREELLANALRIAKLGSWSWDVAGGEVWWSPELHGVYGLDPGTFGGDFASYMERIHPDDQERMSDVVLTAMNQLDHYDIEHRTITPHGELRWIRCEGEIERDDEGVVVRLHGTGQDVTERRAALDAATIASRRLALLQQLAEAANRSTTLADALVRSAQLLEEAPEWTPVCVALRSERGEPLSVLELPEPAGPDLPPPDLDAAEECWRTREMVLTPIDDAGGGLLMSLPVHNGRRMVLVVQISVRLEQPDDYTWSLMTQVSEQLSNVAQRERAAVQLAEARDEAMEASRHKSEFLATMSHEIRTPMNGVIGLTDLLLRSDLDRRQRRLAEGLHGAGLTLLALINDILDLSKIESGKLELEAIEFDVRTVVDETVIILEGPAQDKGLDLVVTIDADVPRLLRGDPVRLGQVLTNLGSNAVKFTDAGEVVVDVRLAPGGDALDGEVVLQVEVRDTGIGISDDHVDGLFDAFTQADRSTTRQHGGTGLGLAISRQLVEGMGGEIGVRSAPGAGSAFWFTARLGEVAADADLSHLDRPLRRRRVLVVADDAVATSSLVRQLTAWQLQVDRAGSAGAAAVALAGAAAEGAPYDVALVRLTGAPVRELADIGEARGVDLVLIGDGGSDLSVSGYAARVDEPVRAAELYRALLAAGTDATNGTSDRRRQERPDLDLRVLVVEDNAVNQLVAIGLLENLGCTAVAVGNGADAVEQLSDGHGYDLVLMDCRMPQMDGFEATRAIRAQESGTRVPIIAMTASALPGERDRCLDAGMDDFLTKPVDPAQLAAAVARAGSAGRGDGSHLVGDAEPANGAAAPATGTLDLERVALLSELVKDGVSFFERGRMSFLSRIDGSLAQISIAVQDGDAERTAADAHQLRGSALNLGLVRVGAAAGAIEDLARTGSLTGADAMVGTLREAIADGVEALAAVGHA